MRRERAARSRAAQPVSISGYIDDLNDTITTARASGDPALRAAVKDRRLVGPASCQLIRATLRSTISTWMKQHPGTLPAKVAALGELPPGGRPKAIVWIGERVRAWQNDFDARLAATRAADGRVGPIDTWISTPGLPRHGVDPDQTMVFLDAARPLRRRPLHPRHRAASPE
jgi:hypothetical protein